jgi:arylsulfatase A-like enzyme
MNRRDFLKLAGVSALSSAFAAVGSHHIRQKDAMASLPHSQQTMPNVILITLDTVRAKSLSLYGHSPETSPHLRRISQDGVLYYRAIATSSWTLPSHGGMFTGRYQKSLKCDFTAPMRGDIPTLAEILLAEGYQTGGFIANMMYCSKEYGLARGFSHYEDYRMTLGQAVITPSYAKRLIEETHLVDSFRTQDNLGKKSASTLNRDFLKWLEDSDPSRPFFAFINYFDAHDPYISPNEYASRLGYTSYREFFEKIDNKRYEDPVILKELLRGYEAAIAYIDDSIGSLYDQLVQTGWMENTILIITSDHGEQFGEHGRAYHGNSLYMDLIWVPLMIIAPGVGKGIRIDQPVSLRDLSATVLALAGVDKPAAFPGQPVDLDGSMPSENPIFSEHILGQHAVIHPMKPGWQRSLVVGDYHYIHNPDDTEELYYLRDDPEELENLASRPDEKSRLVEIRRKLDELR